MAFAGKGLKSYEEKVKDYPKSVEAGGEKPEVPQRYN